ncbi:MAG: LysM peptidoglycan-binding domain-containing protein [Capsulimonadaceae bacterium]|nr:LysM peptidoglycan-binding domain-containing protein [Capsulimonadaceae bacterium]
MNPNSTPPAEPTPNADRLALQLHVFQALSILLAVLLVLGAGIYIYKQTQISPVHVDVNGQHVTDFTDYNAAARALDKLRSDAADGFPSSAHPQFAEKVQIVRYPSNWRDLQLAFSDRAADDLAQKLHVIVNAAAILADNAVVVALPSKDEAQKALDAVTKHYASLPPADPVDGTPKIREKVTIVSRRVPAALAKKKIADAVQVMLTAPPAQTYTVQNRDTGWRIARKFHMRFDKFIESNAGRDINRLSIGDTVNVSVATPPITVIVTKRSQRQEPIRQGASADRAGMRSLTTLTTYVNGVAQGNPETLNVTTLKRAAPARSVM